MKKNKTFTVTINNAKGETRSVQIEAQNEKSAIKKAVALAVKHKEVAAAKDAIIKRVELGAATTPAKAPKAAKLAKAAKAPKAKKGYVEMGGITLTANQAKAMRHLIDAMSGHKKAEPTFSDVGVKEICDLFPTPFVGGAVISTLIEKGLVTKDDAPSDNKDLLGKYIIYFTDLGQTLR